MTVTGTFVAAMMTMILKQETCAVPVMVVDLYRHAKIRTIITLTMQEMDVTGISGDFLPVECMMMVISRLLQCVALVAEALLGKAL